MVYVSATKQHSAQAGVTRYVFQLIARASGTNTISSPTPHHVQSDTCAQPVQDNRVTIAAAVTVAADPGSCTLWAVMVKERGEGGGEERRSGRCECGHVAGKSQRRQR